MSRKIDYMREDIQPARYTRALSHPARIAILNHLNTVGSCNGKELVNLLPVSQATVSQHVKELINAGLIEARQSPPRTIYKIDRECWEKARVMISGLLNLKV
jgi:DNA-binding transcriptional ArsR family regulator